MRQSIWLAAGLGLAAFVTWYAAPAAEHMPAYVAKAVADPGRPEADRQLDAQRKPAETLAFAGIKPGQSVAELIPGRGYFTRLLSKIVGPKGHVYAYPPPRRANAPADAPNPAAAVTAIAGDAAYSNVKVETFSPGKLDVPAPVDLVWTSRNYHDFHNIPNADMSAFNKAVFDALKPGGTYIVLDHAAVAGSGTQATSTLHRIDPEAVKSEVTAAGFELVGQSDLLHSVDDQHTAPVFDSSVKDKTDQFILKFRKPARKK
ncbi:MAG: class I SAM-dependent methyltransferase [Alphaproteobacteria bacterium]|nr:class I SAM-dependent methyltransferase [Alphaproteobacteria bacterium]